MQIGAMTLQDLGTAQDLVLRPSTLCIDSSAARGNARVAATAGTCPPECHLHRADEASTLQIGAMTLQDLGTAQNLMLCPSTLSHRLLSCRRR